MLSCFFEYGSNSISVDGSQYRGRNFQGNPLIFFGNIKALFLKIGVKSPLGFVVSMRNVVSRAGSLSGNVTNSCHVSKVCFL